MDNCINNDKGLQVLRAFSLGIKIIEKQFK